MLQSYTVFVPVTFKVGGDASGEPASEWFRTWTLGVLRDRALGYFGGLTVHAEASGYWRNDAGAVVRDRVQPWEVASEDAATVRVFAAIVRAQCYQDCVYVRFPDGHVELVKGF